MVIEFAFLRGAHEGRTVRFERAVITIGRHPTNDLALDPERDLDASSRHAEIRLYGEEAHLVDLGSSNGTFVNGLRLAGTHVLAHGDVIEFGLGGPKVRVLLAPATVGRVGTTTDRPAVAPKNTELRIAEAVKRQTGTLRSMILGLGLLVVVGGGIAAWLVLRAQREGRSQVTQLLAANDSLARALSARLQETGVADAALEEARADMDRMTGELRAKIRRRRQRERAGRRDPRAATPHRHLRPHRLLRDPRPNKAAVVFIAVEMPDGRTESGTGFNILPTGLIVTNRHVVQSAAGVRAARVAVAF